MTEQQHRSALEITFQNGPVVGYQALLDALKKGYDSIGYARGRNTLVTVSYTHLGYDIFVTRYNTNTYSYLMPENVGMPFNSPYNDYMSVSYTHLDSYIATYQEDLETARLLSPIALTLQMISSNVFWVSILAFPTALFVMRRKKDNAPAKRCV